MMAVLKQKPAPLFEELIPPLFESAHLRDITATKLKSAMLTLPQSKGLYLWGPVGCGKTHAFCALIRHYILSGRSVGRIKFTHLLREIRKSFGVPGNESKIIEWVKKVNKLFIEDLGLSENPETDFAVRTFYEILDYRVEHCLPVFITANKPPEQVEANFDERVGSRLQAACVVMPVSGEDKRRIKVKV